MERLNTEALAALTGQHRVQLRAFPRDVIAAARGISADVLAELGAKSAAAKKVHDCYLAFRERAGAWSRISLKAVLEGGRGDDQAARSAFRDGTVKLRAAAWGFLATQATRRSGFTGR